MKYKGSNLTGRDIATIELLDEIRAYFDEDGAAKNALALGGVRAEDYATTSYVDTSIADLLEMTPELKETIDEITQAIKENQDIIDTLENSIAAKAEQSDLEYQAERIDDIESTINNLYIPTNLSEFNNDVGFITQLYADGKYATKEWMNDNFYNDGEIDQILADYLTETSADKRYVKNESYIEINELFCTGDLGVEGTFTIEGDINAERDVYVGRTISFTQGTHIGIDVDESLILSAFDAIFLNPQGGYVTIDGDLFANEIFCGKFQDQSFSFFNSYEDLLLDMGNTVTIYRKTVINGDLVVTGNIRADGTVSSGGKAEEGDSALADLEERVARLESLIS